MDEAWDAHSHDPVTAVIEFIAENGGGAGVRLRKAVRTPALSVT